MPVDWDVELILGGFCRRGREGNWNYFRGSCNRSIVICIVIVSSSTRHRVNRPHLSKIDFPGIAPVNIQGQHFSPSTNLTSPTRRSSIQNLSPANTTSSQLIPRET